MVPILAKMCESTIRWYGMWDTNAFVRRVNNIKVVENDVVIGLRKPRRSKLRFT